MFGSAFLQPEPRATAATQHIQTNRSRKEDIVLLTIVKTLFDRAVAGKITNQPMPPFQASIIRADCFAPPNGCKSPVSLKADGVADETHRSVGKCKLEPSRVPAAKRIAVRPIPIIRWAENVVSSRDRNAGVGWNGTRAVGSIGIGPGVPQDHFRHILADHERVTGAIGNVCQLQV